MKNKKQYSGKPPINIDDFKKDDKVVCFDFENNTYIDYKVKFSPTHNCLGIIDSSVFLPLYKFKIINLVQESI